MLRLGDVCLVNLGPVYRLDGSGADNAIRDCPCDNLGDFGCLLDPHVDGKLIEDVALILSDAVKDIPVMCFIKASDKGGETGTRLSKKVTSVTR